MSYYPTGNPDVDRLIEEYASREIVIQRSRAMIGEVRFNLILVYPPVLAFPFTSSVPLLAGFLDGTRETFGDYGIRLRHSGNRIEVWLEYYHVITTLNDRQSHLLLLKLQRLHDDLTR